MPKEYLRDLFRLSDKDYKDIGCTKEELDQVQELNQQLDEVYKRLKKEAGLLPAEPGDAPINYDEEVTKRDNLQEQLYNMFLAAAERKLSNWEYAGSQLPDWAQSTGKVPTIDALLRTHGDRLSVIDKAKLLKKRQVTMKAKINEKMALDNKDNPEYGKDEEIKVVSHSENDAFLEGIHQKNFQSSGNGCWSVSTQLQLQSKGIKNVTQSDVRCFRPNYNAQDIKDKFTKEVKKGSKKTVMNEYALENYKIIEGDGGNNLMDRGEAFLKLAPGCMLKGIQIDPYSDSIRKNGITREDYIKNAKQTVKKHILHAIKEDKSPVSFLKGGHYITIVGIDGDKVKYKESKQYKKDQKPDDTFETTLDKLVSRVTRTTVRMEWSAEMKLSQDGKKLYGVPSQYLTVAEDGTVMMPANNENYNVSNGYQIKDGFVVGRSNGSEHPDGNKNLDENLRKGEAHVTELVFLPKTINMDLLKSKAAKRSPEEEMRLQTMSKDFYGVEPGLVEYKTVGEMDTAYEDLEKATNRAFSNKQKEEATAFSQELNALIAGDAPAAAQPNSNTRAYDNYINRLYNENELSENTATFNLKGALVKGVAAAYLKAEGEKFDAKKINALAEKIKISSIVSDMDNKNELLSVLKSPDPANPRNKVQLFDKIQSKVVNSIYGVEPSRQEAYLKEMKMLAENMMPKEGRTPLYQNFYQAVQDAAAIDLNQPGASEKIAEVNKKLVKAIKDYTKGKKKVRSSQDGRDRFDNAMDALSIVGLFSRDAERMDVKELVTRVNTVRDAKTASNKDYVSMRRYGGERAKNRNKEIAAEHEKKTVNMADAEKKAKLAGK